MAVYNMMLIGAAGLVLSLSSLIIVLLIRN